MWKGRGAPKSHAYSDWSARKAVTCEGTVTGVDVCDADFKKWAMEFLGTNSALIEAARREFESFYATASPEDVGWMDALVVTHTVLLKCINTPRENLPPILRRVLERTCDATERVYTDLRENVRLCASFARLSAEEQMRIAQLVFEVPSTWLPPHTSLSLMRRTTPL